MLTRTRKHFPTVVALSLLCIVCSVSAADEKKTKTSDFKFDTAPGLVTATGMLGIGADDVTTVKNPRDLTVVAKAFDSKNALGISVTPARTSLAPLDLSTYSKEPLSPCVRLLVG